MTRRRRIALIVAVSCANALVAFLATVYPVFHGEVGPEDMAFDVRVYFDYARHAVLGYVPYREYVVEYPILALPVIFFPVLLTTDPKVFQSLFAGEMLLVNVAAVSAITWWTDTRRGLPRAPAALAWYSLFFLSFCPMIVARFDLAPMTLAFLAGCSWFRGRSVRGGILSAAGTLMKVYPGIIAVVATTWEWSGRRPGWRRGLLAFASTFAVGATAWFLVGGENVKHSLRFQVERGLEVNSLYSGVVVLLGQLTGTPVVNVFEHSGDHTHSPWSSRVAACALPIQAMVLLLVFVRFIRRPAMDDPIRFTTAALLALIVTNKVFSPQYLIWLFPFIAVLEGRAGPPARWLFLLCCLMTTVIFPWHYRELVRCVPWVVVLLNVRNLLLLALLGLLLFDGRESRTGRIRETPRRSQLEEKETAGVSLPDLPKSLPE